MNTIIVKLFLISIILGEAKSNNYLEYVQSPECRNELFLLENSHYQPGKGDYKIRNPGFFWKSQIEIYNIGKEIYEELDESTYEYMFHAFHPKFGLEVYRVCPKKGNYHKYGKIESHLGNGYRMNISQLLSVDVYLLQQGFQLNINRDREIRNHIKTQKKLKKENYMKNYPIWGIFWQILEDTLMTLCYLAMTSPFIFLLYCMLST